MYIVKGRTNALCEIFVTLAIDLLEIFLMFVCVVQTLTLEDGRPGLVVTDLAENKVYMKFSNWWDQILLHGALPFLVLAVSNIRYGGSHQPCRHSIL